MLVKPLHPRFNQYILSFQEHKQTKFAKKEEERTISHTQKRFSHSVVRAKIVEGTKGNSTYKVMASHRLDFTTLESNP